MKTKIFFIFLLMFISSWTSNSASVVHKYLNTSNNPEYLYACSVDSIIVHMPINAINGIDWTGPSGHENGTFVVVTNTNTGRWLFYSNEVDKDFYVYILTSGPVRPTCMIRDTNFCTVNFSLYLDAENQNPGGHASNYEWSKNSIVISTNRTITVTTPGTYNLKVTNACGIGTYTKNITQGNPNAPNLGADRIVCWGQHVILNPQSNNVISTLWSTGETTPTAIVDTTGTYWVYLVDANGCSGRDTIHVTTTLPRKMEMCAVTYDTSLRKNSISWFVNPLETEIDSVRISVNQLGIYIALATVPYAQGHYIHMGSNPQADDNEYYITAITDCGEGEHSMVHKSIWLTTLTNELQ